MRHVTATPRYRGIGQPSADTRTSWLGRIGLIFGTPTPAYAGTGEQTCGSSSKGTPQYRPAAATCEFDDEADTCVFEAESLAPGKIAIVIPREPSTP